MRGEVVHRHPARQERLDVGEGVGQGEGKLGDGVRPGLRDVIAGDRHRIEVAHAAVDEPLLDVGHAAQRELGGEDAGVLPLVLLEDVGLHRPAQRAQGARLDLPALAVVEGASESLLGKAHLLVDRRGEVHREDRRRGAIDGHRHRGRRVAQVESGEELAHVVERRDAHPGRADLAVDVGPGGGVSAVEGDRVEGDRQPRRGLPVRQEVEASIGAGRVAFSREHARGRLGVAFEREDPGREREAAREVLLAQVAHQVRVRRRARDADARDGRARRRGAPALVARPGGGALAFPRGESLEGVGLQAGALLGGNGFEVADGQATLGEQGGCGLRGLQSACCLGLRCGDAVVVAHGVGDVRQVAHASGRHDAPQCARPALGRQGEIGGVRRQAPLGEQGAQVSGERGDAVVAEAGCGSAEDGHVLPGRGEVAAIAQELACHVAVGVLGALPLKLVDRDDVGEVQHVDLLQLAGRPVLRRHDVEGDVHVLADRAVALPHARGLDDDEVVSRRGACTDHVVEPGRDRGAPRRHRMEEDAVVRGGVHPDAVAEERSAGAGARGVDGEDRDAGLVPAAQAPHDLVGEARLARAAGAGDAEDGDLSSVGRSAQFAEHRRVKGVVLDPAQRGAERALVPGEHVGGHGRGCSRARGALREHVVDHPDQAQALAVLGGVDAHAARSQGVDLCGDDDPAAAAEDADVRRAGLAQPIHQVVEVLHVPALVGRHGDRVGALLECGAHDGVDAAVVAEVHDLGAPGLQDAAHDRDRGVVAIEEAGRRHESQGLALRHGSSRSSTLGAPAARVIPAGAAPARWSRSGRPRDVPPRGHG